MSACDALDDFYKSFSDIKQRACELSPFDVIEEYEHRCCDRLSVLDLTPEQQNLLRFERNSWRLVRGIIANKIRTIGKAFSP